MAKNIVVCCDGTNNEIGVNLTNVTKLFRMLEKSNGQRVYYNPGVGTIGEKNPWQRWKQKIDRVLGLAFGAGLDADVLNAYRFICHNYAEGDRLYFFGFSRGAYTVRVLAAFILNVGLLPPDQLNLAGFAFSIYKKTSADAQNAKSVEGGKIELRPVWDFARVAGTRPAPIEFVGVWDTVASVIVPREDTLWFAPDMQVLANTRNNRAVKIFRQAIAIDERRRMFRLNVWQDPQKFRPVPWDSTGEAAQDIRQVWFAGVHSDIGGGYPESESALSKFPLLWMVEQALKAGVAIDRGLAHHLIYGSPNPRSRHDYQPPDCTGAPHDSLTGFWRALEWIPKKWKWNEWKKRPRVLGHYLPKGEPRPIPDGARIHHSVFDRISAVADYRPINLPQVCDTELPTLLPPAPPPVSPTLLPPAPPPVPPTLLPPPPPPVPPTP